MSLADATSHQADRHLTHRSPLYSRHPDAASLLGRLGHARMLRLDPDALRAPSGLIPEGQAAGFLDDRGRGLPGVYFTVRNYDEHAFARIVETARQYFPTSKNLRLKPVTNSTLELEAELTDGTRVRAEHLSAGLLYFLAILALPYLSPVSLLLSRSPRTAYTPRASPRSCACSARWSRRRHPGHHRHPQPARDQRAATGGGHRGDPPVARAGQSVHADPRDPQLRPAQRRLRPGRALARRQLRRYRPRGRRCSCVSATACTPSTGSERLARRRPRPLDRDEGRVTIGCSQRPAEPLTRAPHLTRVTRGCATPGLSPLSPRSALDTVVPS